MHQHISRVTLMVKDFDEALAFYTQALKFEVVEDTQRTPEKDGSS